MVHIRSRGGEYRPQIHPPPRERFTDRELPKGNEQSELTRGKKKSSCAAKREKKLSAKPRSRAVPRQQQVQRATPTQVRSSGGLPTWLVPLVPRGRAIALGLIPHRVNKTPPSSRRYSLPSLSRYRVRLLLDRRPVRAVDRCDRYSDLTRHGLAVLTDTPSSSRCLSFSGLRGTAPGPALPASQDISDILLGIANWSSTPGAHVRCLLGCTGPICPRIPRLRSALAGTSTALNDALEEPPLRPG